MSPILMKTSKMKWQVSLLIVGIGQFGCHFKIKKKNFRATESSLKFHFSINSWKTPLSCLLILVAVLKKKSFQTILTGTAVCKDSVDYSVLGKMAVDWRSICQRLKKG